MSEVKIYQASAGSGKTFILSLELIKLLLTGEENYKHILAVTFTNKATNEMKHRILEELNVLGSNQQSHLLPYILQSTGLDERTIRGRAKKQLSQILYDYSSFTIETIDSFFQKIIRSFAHEMGLYDAVRLELSYDQLLNDSVYELLNQLAQNKELKKWLLNFTFQNIEENEHWDIKKSIKTLGKELYREELQLEGEELFERLADKKFLDSFLVDLKKIVKNFEDNLEHVRSTILKLIAENNLDVTDFKGKSRSLMVAITKTNTPKGLSSIQSKLDQLTDPDAYCPTTGGKKNVISNLFPEFVPLLQSFVDYYISGYVTYMSARNVLANFYSLGILSDLLRASRKISGDQNFFLIQESNLLLQKLIGNSDVPFVYEKVGYRIHHIMIDEFQDTSKMQYLNFKPLLLNSLAEGKKVVVVGDVKQSIYRWRNGDWNILANDIHRDFVNQGVDLHRLEYNYRSNGKLIHFNNLFFQSIAEVFRTKIDQYSKAGNTGNSLLESFNFAYESAVQKVPDHPHQMESNALIDIELVQKQSLDSFETEAFSKLEKWLINLQDNGIELDETAILFRSKKEGRKIAQFLDRLNESYANSHYEFNYVSEDVSSLGNSELIVFIVSVLKLIFNANDYLARTEVLVFLFKRNRLRPGVDFWGSIRNDKEFYSFFDADFETFLKTRSSLQIENQVNEIARFFNLSSFRNEWLYIDAFQNWIYTVSRHKNLNISELVLLWEENKESINLDLGGTSNAIQLLTIHKSKGLQFDAVLMPFCTWRFKTNSGQGGSFLWCKTHTEPFNKLALLPLVSKKELGETLFMSDYYQEEIKTSIDNLNLLYVAFTRAKKALCVFGMLDANSNTMSHFLQKNLQKIQFAHLTHFHAQDFEPGLNRFYYNTLQKQVKPSQEKEGFEPSELYVQANKKELAIKTSYSNIEKSHAQEIPSGFLEYGVFMHELFSEIKKLNDISYALGKRVKTGVITTIESQKLAIEIKEKLKKLKVLDWFEGNYVVKTEAEFINSFGKIKIPDRIMTGKNETIIVDYKFGQKEEPFHYNQVLSYKKLINKLLGGKIRAYLFYYSLEKIVEVK